MSTLDRWDLHLLFIPLSIASGLLAAVVSPLSIAVGTAVGSLAAALAVVDGVALNPPTRR